jgi:heterodisulfide reductase subunit B
MTAFSYYPGCSLHSTAVEYDDSVQSVFAALGVQLHELEDWNCCGASSAHSLNRSLSLALPARNLALAQEAGRDVVMPCAACFNRHKTADYEMRTREDYRETIEKAVGFQYDGTVAVRPLLDVIGNGIGIERLKARVRKPLAGLRVVSYYGCLLVRPANVTQFENPENPTLMSNILDAVGADVQSWSYTTDCCGGGLALTKPELAMRLVNRLTGRAREAGAQAIVTSCPLCHVNLEMRQAGERPKMPIFYFTELIGLAFGLEKASHWWRKHLIDPIHLLEQVELG